MSAKGKHTMTRYPAARRERLHLRLDADSKRLLERAAAYSAATVSEFVLSHAVEAAEAVIEAHDPEVLGPDDWDTLLAALDNPPAPNEALRAGFRWYAAHRQ